jgi:hypothetical protein
MSYPQDNSGSTFDKHLVPHTVSEEEEDDDEETHPTCAMRLNDYQVHDEIGFSHNPEYHHPFHRDCIEECMVTEA